MNSKFHELASKCWEATPTGGFDYCKFGQLVVAECIDKIETHRIPVGNSRAGELACEWTYASLEEIRDKIQEHFGVDDEPTI
jgi:hypothetical protein